MANKFLGALGLDVLVNKIKDVIAKVDTKQDNLQIPIYTLGQPNPAIPDVASLFAIKGISMGEDGNMSLNPNGITIFTPCGVPGGLSIRPLCSDAEDYVEINNAISLLQALQSGDSWTPEPLLHKIYATVRYQNNKIQVLNGTEWKDFEFPAGTTVEEITADEVTNKFA